VNVEVLDRLGEIDQATVVRCARVLLRRPMLRAGGPDGELLPLVYRHRAALGELFTALLGYRLVVERRFARLYKTGPGADPTRGEPTLGPRGYAYLALCLAVLTGAGRQTLLSRLVADIRTAAAEAGIEVSEDLADLRALGAALRHLIALGVITETEGTVGGLGGEAPTEALITVDTTILGHLVAGPVGTAGTPTELVTLAQRPGARGVEHAVRRRLVEHPVTHYAELSADEATWLRGHARAEARLLERCFGLVTETRLEGVAVTDPEDYLTDIAFPGQSTVSRIALLALPQLLAGVGPREGAGAEPDEHGRVAVTEERVATVCAEIVDAYPDAWSRQAVASLARLVDDVLRLLHALGLATPAGDEVWLVNPSAHRWMPQPDGAPKTADTPEDDGPPGWSLFDEGEGAGW
jgi:uncharacterized protein (TIGR02678 family)